MEEEREEEEAEEILEKVTLQLKNSGWSREDCKEIIVSGYKNWKRRIFRRKEEGEKYIGAQEIPSRADQEES